MNSTGTTGWDFLISLRIPFWSIIIIVVFVFCIINADKLLALSGAIAGLFRNISKNANKKYISASIRSSVIAASKRMGLNESAILPADLKIKWAEGDDIKSFFDDDCVVIRIRKSVDPNENYVNIIYQFVSSGLLKNRTQYFDAQIMEASTLLLTQKIISFSKPAANSLFISDYYKPAIENDSLVEEDFDKLRRIDCNGMFFNIYLNELVKAVATIDGQIPDPCLIAESSELLRFLYNVATREPNEAMEMTYTGVYFKIGIMLAANDVTLEKNGWGGHFRYAKTLLEKGLETIYIFGIGRKSNVASKIAYAVKDSDDRVVKSITHQYKHISAKTGARLTAICVELDTY